MYEIVNMYGSNGYYFYNVAYIHKSAVGGDWVMNLVTLQSAVSNVPRGSGTSVSALVVGLHSSRYDLILYVIIQYDLTRG